MLLLNSARWNAKNRGKPKICHSLLLRAIVEVETAQTNFHDYVSSFYFSCGVIQRKSLILCQPTTNIFSCFVEIKHRIKNFLFLKIKNMVRANFFNRFFGSFCRRSGAALRAGRGIDFSYAVAVPRAGFEPARP